MASKRASQALRNSLRQLSSPRVQQRTFAAVANGSRPAFQKAATASFVQQTRGMKTVDFAGDKEVVYGRGTAYHVLCQSED
jgi:ketol-acid reductoisomerase